MVGDHAPRVVGAAFHDEPAVQVHFKKVGVAGLQTRDVAREPVVEGTGIGDEGVGIGQRAGHADGGVGGGFGGERERVAEGMFAVRRQLERNDAAAERRVAGGVCDSLGISVHRLRDEAPCLGGTAGGREVTCSPHGNAAFERQGRRVLDGGFGEERVVGQDGLPLLEHDAADALFVGGRGGIWKTAVVGGHEGRRPAVPHRHEGDADVVLDDFQSDGVFEPRHHVNDVEKPAHPRRGNAKAACGDFRLEVALGGAVKRPVSAGGCPHFRPGQIASVRRTKFGVGIKRHGRARKCRGKYRRDAHGTQQRSSFHVTGLYAPGTT